MTSPNHWWVTVDGEPETRILHDSENDANGEADEIRLQVENPDSVRVEIVPAGRYFFDARPNSYFEGHDLRVESAETHETILVNRKDGMWAVNVKDDVSGSHYPADVKAALELLPESVQDALYEEGKRDFWDSAHLLAQGAGFERIYQIGRSGGWMALAGTEDWSPADIFDYKKNAKVQAFLIVAFEAAKSIEGARDYYFSRVRETMQELQSELSEFADWVGAEVRTLDGAIEKVERLVIRDGRPCLDFFQGFAFAHEATLVRRADGNVPARLTADPIMEQVFQIIEARGELTREELDEFFEDEEGNDPSRLYEDYIGPAISALEARMRTWKREGGSRFGEVELSAFLKDANDEWPTDTCFLCELNDGQLFEDAEGRVFNRVGDGPTQGSVEIVDDEETHAYWDVVTRVKPN